MSEPPAKRTKKFDPMKLLEKQGWKKGQGLGKEGQGLTTYLTVKPVSGSYGVGADMSKQDYHLRDMASLFEKAMTKVGDKAKKKKKKEKKEEEEGGEEVGAYGFVSGGIRKTAGEELYGGEEDEAEEKEVKKEKKSKKEKKEKKEKKDKKEKKKEKKGKKEKMEDVEIEDSSDEGGPVGPLGALSDEQLFAAMGGARFGKLGRHSNSAQKIARIQKAEEEAGRAHIQKVKDKSTLWKRKRSKSRSQVRSPKASPAALPTRSPSHRPKK
eukprot:Hpha_TRINITY_DN15360_c3_g13::TRINITY_DN15360_c3_g13_i1::g.90464::m.90464